MGKAIFSILIKFLSVDTIVAIIAKCFSWLIIWARKWDKWTQFKLIVNKINGYTSLLLEVYEDDELTAEEEKRIADALKNEESINKVSDVIIKKLNKEVSTEGTK